MATSSSTFSVSRPQEPLRIIHYSGPPAPKLPSQCSNPKNTVSTITDWHDIDKMSGKELVLNAQTEGREILAPTCFRAESEGNSLQNTVVTDNQAELNTNGKEEDPPSDEYPPLDDEYLSEDCRPIGMEIDSVKGTEIPISLLSSREPTSTPPKSTVDKFGDTIERHVISDTDSDARSDCSIGQPRQEEVSSSTVPKGTHQLQSLMEKAKSPGEFSTPENATSSGFSDSDGDESVGNNDTMYDTLPTRKRKHLTPAHTVGRKRHSRKPNTTLKQYPERAVSSMRRQKPSPFRGRAFANRPLAIKPTPGARVGICGTKIHSNDSSDEDSEESNDHGCRPRSNERPKSTTHLHRWGRHEWKRDGGRASRPNISVDSMEVFSLICLPTVIDSSDSISEEELSKPQNNEHAPLCSKSEVASPMEPGEDDEYEVEQILDARVYYRRLQYRVKWLGYENDPEWYDASNFKNSPYKLRDFYTANSTRPGPPKRLGRWVECWEEDRDADDHPDDNKPEKSYTGGGIP